LITLEITKVVFAGIGVDIRFVNIRKSFACDVVEGERVQSVDAFLDAVSCETSFEVVDYWGLSVLIKCLHC
jgi:hypothetical protein